MCSVHSAGVSKLDSRDLVDVVEWLVDVVEWWCHGPV
jgi:hypothetical protein